jgi:UDP-glucose 4-epimerase
MTTTRRALVTGAAGFIGSHLCRRLVADGIDVVGLDDLSESTGENLRDVPDVRLVEADVRDRDAVADAARGCSAIYHQAAKRSVSRSMEEPELTTDVNVRGTLNVLLAARDAGAAVVAASSSSVYGDQTEFPVHEGLAPMPRSPYAASKLALEVYCGALHRSYGIPTVALRYFNAYGPGQDPESEYAAVVPRFAVACLTGARPQVHGDGEQSRDFTYIGDVVEANLLAARASERAWGRAYNVGGGGEPTSVNRLLDMIAERVGVDPDPVHTDPRPGDIRRSMADVSLAEELLGFSPKVAIDEGVSRTVDWFRASYGPGGLSDPAPERG